MPDTRRHRGLHPEDPAAFSPAALPALRSAVADMSLLLERGYTTAATLKLVGDRYQLTTRQRSAVWRCACAPSRAAERRARMVPAEALVGGRLLVDGFNVLTTLEVALSGGIVLVAADGTLRDIAGVHGTYRQVEETLPALNLLAEHVEGLGVKSCELLFDRPVSNSGRVTALVNGREWSLTARVADDPDAELGRSPDVVASADGIVLDRSARWYNLARKCVAAGVTQARLVDLSQVPTAVDEPRRAP